MQIQLQYALNLRKPPLVYLVESRQLNASAHVDKQWASPIANESHSFSVTLEGTNFLIAAATLKLTCVLDLTT